MDFNPSTKTSELQDRLTQFMDAEIYPVQDRYRQEVDTGDRWQPLQLIEEVKEKAKATGLWNLFLPDVSGLSNLEYAPLAETMGRVV